MRDYLEQATAALVASGHSPDDARRAARLETREHHRRPGTGARLRMGERDRNVVRRSALCRPPAAHIVRALPAVSVLTLALGIGASTAIFSAVNPILFEPLPYPHAGRIMMIWDIFQGARSDVTFHTYRELAARNRSFDALAVMEAWQPTMTSATQPERFDGQSVSCGLLPCVGRVAGAGKGLPGSRRSLQRSPCSDPQRRIVAAAFRRRQRHRGAPGHARRQSVYRHRRDAERVRERPGSLGGSSGRPCNTTREISLSSDTAEWGHHLRMVGRLRPGLGVDQARRELNAIALAPVPEFPRARWASLKYGLIVNSLQAEITRGVKPVLLAVLGAVVLVLLIASVNVTNLLLARGAQRRGEFAMRAALGAGRPRLIRQLLTESLLLATLGGALGIVVAEFGVAALVALSPPGLPRVSAIAVDGTVFAFAFRHHDAHRAAGRADSGTARIPRRSGHRTAAKLTAHRRRSPMDAPYAGGRGGCARPRAAGECGIAVAQPASVCSRSLRDSMPPHLLTMQVQYSGHRFDDDNARRRFLAQALEAVRHVPGVATAAFTSLLPLSGDQYGTYGAPVRGRRRGYDVFRYVATPGYCETMGIPLRRGRLLDGHDAQPARRRRS